MLDWAIGSIPFSLTIAALGAGLTYAALSLAPANTERALGNRIEMAARLRSGRRSPTPPS